MLGNDHRVVPSVDEDECLLEEEGEDLLEDDESITTASENVVERIPIFGDLKYLNDIKSFYYSLSYSCFKGYTKWFFESAQLRLSFSVSIINYYCILIIIITVATVIATFLMLILKLLLQQLLSLLLSLLLYSILLFFYL